MSLTKYKALMIALILTLFVLLTIANYSGYYTINDYGIFIILEMVSTLIVILLVVIIIKFDSFLTNEGYTLLSENQLYKLRDIRKVKPQSALNKDFFNE